MISGGGFTNHDSNRPEIKGKGKCYVLLVKGDLLGIKKKNHFRIIVVCMKYKCQMRLVFQGCCMKRLYH